MRLCYEVNGIKLEVDLSTVSGRGEGSVNTIRKMAMEMLKELIVMAEDHRTKDREKVRGDSR